MLHRSIGRVAASLAFGTFACGQPDDTGKQPATSVTVPSTSPEGAAPQSPSLSGSSSSPPNAAGAPGLGPGAVPDGPPEPIAQPPIAQPPIDPPEPVAQPEPSPVAAAEPEPTPEPATEPEASVVDCSAILDRGWELCDSGPDFCAAVFTDGAGCDAVCAAVGLACSEVWEDTSGECSADTSREPLGCGTGAAHMSDYCICSGGGPGAPVEPSAEPETPVEPVAEPAPEPAPQPEPMPEPQPEPQPQPQQPDIGPRACGCENATEEYGTVNDTIVVGPGQTYDGECKIHRANPGTLGDGSQSESQSPVFRLENGATLRNVVLGASAADGIHTAGNVTLENVHWLDIGEDALTIKESGTVRLDCGSAKDGDDKVFQVNAAAEFHISNFTASNAGKFMRQNGGTDFEVRVFIDHCDISRMDEVIFRTDSSSSHVTLTNTRYSQLGDGLFMFGDQVQNGNSNQSTVSNNQQY